MVVFKTFLKVLNKCKIPIIIYTAILVIFAGFNMSNNDSMSDFSATKPDILIVNNDKEEGVTKNLVEYLNKKTNVKDISLDDEAIKDALFYRDVNYVIYIPENYRQDFLNGKNPQIEIKSTGDYQSELARMLLERYVKVAQNYRKETSDEEELISKINDTMSKEVQVEIKSKLDTETLQRLTTYFNFASYAILAVGIYVVCMILTSFRDEKIKNRTNVSSMNYKKINRNLFLSNCLFGIVLWMFYLALPVFLIGNIMFSTYGFMFAINSFTFTICALAIAFFVGNLGINKNAVSGIVNVISLGSSFLCGAFVPMQYLPNFVLKIAHILPTYWYIKNNEIIGNADVFSSEVFKSIWVNIAVVIGFIVLLIVLTNVFSSKNRKSN